MAKDSTRKWPITPIDNPIGILYTTTNGNGRKGVF